MAEISKVERRRELLIQLEADRKSLASECQEASGGVRWIDSGMEFVSKYQKPLKFLLPVAALLLFKGRRTLKPILKQGLSFALLYRDFTKD